MKRETVKALLENGVLQAYAEGKEIEFSLPGVNNWASMPDYDFDARPDQYRIKPTPQFKVGDLVRDKNHSTGVITALTTSREAYVELSSKNGLKHIYPLRELTPIREVRTPLTFEQAVKLVAEKGVEVQTETSSATITGLGKTVAYLNLGELSYKRAAKFRWEFPDGTPFANVTYEDIT